MPPLDRDRAALEAVRGSLTEDHLGIRRLIDRLEALAGSDPGRGREAAAREIVARIDAILLVHIADEEDDLFPAILAGATSPARRAQAYEAVSLLLVEHRRMTELWVGLRAALAALGGGLNTPFPRQVAQELAALCRRHLDREDRELSDLLAQVGEERLRGIGASMRARRERAGGEAPHSGRAES
jgi:hemerythrin-like domain-containing protein